jgi:glucose-1-phosphate adenylyltransferase
MSSFLWERNVLAVILGGGAGTRLHPLTRYRSKPAVPLAGKYRLIDIPISNCINSGIDRIFVLTQYNSASLNRHVALSYLFDHFRSGFVTVLAAEQTPTSRDWYQGTADAVRQSIHHFDSHPHSHVLVLSGDQLYLMNYRTLFDFHTRSNAAVTIATIPVSAEDASSFGILKTDEQGRITEFHEKPKQNELEGLESPVSDEMREAGRVYLGSMGIYLFNREMLGDMLAADVRATDFGKEIIPRAIDRHRLMSFPFTGYWDDIGTIGSFYEANLNLASKLPDFDLYSPTMPIFTHARMLPPAKVQSSYVQDSIISEASVIIDSHIVNSVIGIRSFIGPNTTLKHTVMMGADYLPWHDREHRSLTFAPDHPGIGENSIIEKAIIDKNVSVGKGCVIKNQDGIQEGEGDLFVIRDGIVVLPKNAVIPDGTVI